jgi:hypothetical protein
MPDKGLGKWEVQFNNMLVTRSESREVQFNNMPVAGLESREVQFNDVPVT